MVMLSTAFLMASVLPISAQTELSAKSVELSVQNCSFKSTLDSIVDVGSECTVMTVGLNWVIGITHIDSNEYKLVLTLTNGLPDFLPDKYPFYGHFYIDSVLICVVGDRIDSLFKPMDSTTLIFQRPEGIPPPEHHSLWYFKYGNGDIKMSDSVVLPCNKKQMQTSP